MTDRGVEFARLVGGRMTRFAIAGSVVVWLVVVGWTLTVRAQSASYVHPTVTVVDGILRIKVDDPRALFRALRELQRQYGCTASYEDLPLEHAGDIVESVIAPTGYRYIGPRGGALTFSHPFGVAGDPDAFEGAVRALARTYEDQGFPGRFRVEREGVMLHVIPTEMRGKTGDVVAVRPLMDAPLIFAVRDWTDFKGVEAVVDGVRAVTAASITLGQLPLNVMMRHRARVGADNEPARTVLGRLLMTPYTRMSWAALYDLTRRHYYLHLQSVPSATPRDPTRPACWDF